MKRLQNKQQKHKTTNNEIESEVEDNEDDNDDKDNNEEDSTANYNKIELIVTDNKINKTADTVLQGNIENERAKIDSNTDIIKETNNETNIKVSILNNINTDNILENIENNVLTTITK